MRYEPFEKGISRARYDKIFENVISPPNLRKKPAELRRELHMSVKRYREIERMALKEARDNKHLYVASESIEKRAYARKPRGNATPISPTEKAMFRRKVYETAMFPQAKTKEMELCARMMGEISDKSSTEVNVKIDGGYFAKLFFAESERARKSSPRLVKVSEEFSLLPGETRVDSGQGASGNTQMATVEMPD